MDKPSFDQLLYGAKVLAGQGRGTINCTYTLAAQGKAYPRTCDRCGLGPCPFQDFLLTAAKEAKESHEVQLIKEWQREDSYYPLNKDEEQAVHRLVRWLRKTHRIA